MRLTDSRGLLVRVLEGSARGLVPTLIRALLIPLSLVAGVLLTLRRWAYEAGLLKVHKLNVPAISIGNLTVGGTGKTPLAAWLAGWLREQGRNPAVLSRGYGAAKPKAPDAEIKNDERLLLERTLPHVPHYASPDRVKAAREAVAAGADCLVLDDGFQHLRVERNVNLVLIDALNPFGGGWLLPAGLLREPLGALRAADAVILTRADAVPAEERQMLRQRIARTARDRPILEAAHRPTHLTLPEDKPLDTLAGRKVYLFCGLGNPWGVVKTVEQIGANIVGARFFRDHFHYRNGDLARLAEECSRAGAQYAVTTLKDAVKIGGAWKGATPLCILHVTFEFTTDTHELEAMLRAALSS